jgi:hypothetical protein
MGAPTTSGNLKTHDRSQQEREAIDRLLASGVFDRSPNLAVFLRYVCSRYFEGRLDDVREYNIAVEALGRPASFDQKRDAIVRVEAHRLRKRLQQYYAGKGADEPVWVDIPAGSYAPQFHFRYEDGPDAAVEESAVELVELDNPTTVLDSVAVEPETSSVPRHPEALVPRSVPSTRLPWYVLGALLLLVAAGGLYLVGRSPVSAVSPVAPQPIPVATNLSEVRIMAGSTAARYVDAEGNIWSGDRFFTGGAAASVPERPIARTLDSALYLARRQGEFRYDIPLKAGTYELRLHFAETMFGENTIQGGGEASRIFSVWMNGQALIGYWDVLADANGSNTANIKVFRDVQPASDGYLHLEFRPSFKEAPFVNAIEIVPGIPGHMRPVRIVARPSAYTDAQSLQWSSDRYYHGGQYVGRTDEIERTPDQALYRSERYGNFTYVIPVLDRSTYSATLRFCEHWFGPGRPGNGGVGSRVFDVYMNGRILLEHFDIFKEAGGALRPLDKTFHNLKPNAQGKLVFQFVPIQNYALINGIAVVDEGR